MAEGKRLAECRDCGRRWPVSEGDRLWSCPSGEEHYLIDLVPLSRWGLIRLAFEQRARYDEEWGPGWWFRPGDREYGPFLTWLWPWAVALKCAICILLGRRGADSYRDEVIEVAMYQGKSHGGMDGTWHSWRYVQVVKGWRLRTWRFDEGTEST